MRFFILHFVFAICTTYAIQAQQSEPLILQTPISGQLDSGEVDEYTLSLDTNEFVHAFALQKSVDVVVEVQAPSGSRILRVDGPAKGKEHFSFTSTESGEHLILVKPFEDQSGSYEITLSYKAAVASDPHERLTQLCLPYSGDDQPGVSVLVIRNGQRLTHRNFGMANLTHGIPMTDSTRHNLGSTSKQFTALGILVLQDQGLLSLEDDIRQYIPELPDFGDTVRIGHLLTHRSGYREFLNTLSMSGMSLSSPIERERIIKMIQNQPELQNVPGTEFNYNNTGYVLLAELIERVGEQPYRQWMEEKIFHPLGMQDSRLRGQPGIVIPHRSSGYQQGANGQFEEVNDLGGALGAGGIYTTMDDLQAWILEFLDPSSRFQPLIEQMKTGFVESDTLQLSGDYRLGLMCDTVRGLVNFQHGGADLAHRSSFFIFPDIESALVIQSNNAGISMSLAMQIMEVFFEDEMDAEEEPTEENAQSADEKDAFKYNPADFEPLTGRYQLVPGFILSFFREEDRIYTQATGQPDLDLTPTSDSTFQVQGVEASLTFHLNPDGSADSVTLHQMGARQVAHKLEWEASEELKESYCGRYFSDEIETVYTISLEEGQLMLNHYILGDIPLEFTEKDRMAGGFPIGEIKMTRDKKGAIDGFTVSNGRTRGLRFDKWEE